MTVIRIEPWAVRQTARRGDEQTARWGRLADDLRQAIDHFLATSSEHVPQIEDLPGDLAELAARSTRLDEHLLAVAAAFEDLDGQLQMGAVHFVSELELARRVGAGPVAMARLRPVLEELREIRQADLGPLARADAVRETFAGLSVDMRLALARAEPALIGNTAGVPVELRYVANRISMQAALERATTEMDRLRSLGEPVDTRLEGRVANLRRLLFEPYRTRDPATGHQRLIPRQVLIFDPDGDGRAAEVFGDLSTAEHVATFVPGITNRLDNFQNTSGNAQRIYDLTNETDGATATIAWLGYDTPEHVDAPSRLNADRWAPALADFQASLPASLVIRDARTTVIGHSYGSLLTGVSIREEGLRADAFAVIGSPGLNVTHASQLGLPDDVPLFAGRAHQDPVSLSESHGTDPAKPYFGAIPFETGDIEGHSAYTARRKESLKNLARIVVGHEDKVTRDGWDIGDVPRRSIPVVGPAVQHVSDAYRLHDDLVLAKEQVREFVADARNVAAGAVSWTDDQLDRAWQAGGDLAGDVAGAASSTLTSGVQVVGDGIGNLVDEAGNLWRRAPWA